MTPKNVDFEDTMIYYSRNGSSSRPTRTQKVVCRAMKIIGWGPGANPIKQFLLKND